MSGIFPSKLIIPFLLFGERSPPWKALERDEAAAVCFRPDGESQIHPSVPPDLISLSSRRLLTDSRLSRSPALCAAHSRACVYQSPARGSCLRRKREKTETVERHSQDTSKPRPRAGLFIPEINMRAGPSERVWCVAALFTRMSSTLADK